MINNYFYKQGPVIKLVGFLLLPLLVGCVTTGSKSLRVPETALRTVDMATMTGNDLVMLSLAMAMKQAEISKDSSSVDRMKAQLAADFIDDPNDRKEIQVMLSTGRSGEVTRFRIRRYEEVLAPQVDAWRNVDLSFKTPFNKSCASTVPNSINSFSIRNERVFYSTSVYGPYGDKYGYDVQFYPSMVGPLDAKSISLSNGSSGKVIVKTSMRAVIPLPITKAELISLIEKKIRSSTNTPDLNTLCVSGDVSLKFVLREGGYAGPYPRLSFNATEASIENFSIK